HASLLRPVRPHPAHGRRPDPHLPFLAHRVRLPRRAARRGERRGDRRPAARGGPPQGAGAPHQQPLVPPARARNERHRWLRRRTVLRGRPAGRGRAVLLPYNVRGLRPRNSRGPNEPSGGTSLVRDEGTDVGSPPTRPPGRVRLSPAPNGGSRAARPPSFSSGDPFMNRVRRLVAVLSLLAALSVL